MAVLNDKMGGMPERKKVMTRRQLMFPLVLMIIFTSCDSAPKQATQEGVTPRPTNIEPVAVVEKKQDTYRGRGNFRGIVWGSDITKVPGIRHMFTNEANGTMIYTQRDEKMKIGDAVLESIIYSAFQDQFCNALITSRGYTNWTYLKNAVFAKYGDAEQPNEYIERYYWRSTGKLMRLMVSLNYNEYTEKATLLISDIALAEQFQDYEKERAKAGAKSDF